MVVQYLNAQGPGSKAWYHQREKKTKKLTLCARGNAEKNININPGSGFRDVPLQLWHILIRITQEHLGILLSGSLWKPLNGGSST